MNRTAGGDDPPQQAHAHRQPLMPARNRPATPAQRQQRGEQRQARLAELHTQLVQQVAALTDADGWRAWLTFAARFHSYSFNNTILIMFQRPDATWVAGIKRWNAMGRRVRPGEKGIAILAPVTARADPDGQPGPTDPPQAANAVSATRPGVVDVTGPDVTALVTNALAALDGATQPGRVLRGFTIATVFDIAQTEGDPVDPPHRPIVSDVDSVLLTGQAPPGVWDALVAIATEHGYHVERGGCDPGVNGYIHFGDHRIRVRDDVDDAQAVKTLIHELGHMLLHNPDDFLDGSTAACRGEKEVEAESVAFLVAAHAGLDTSDYTFGYVTTWAQRAVAATGKAPHEVVAATGGRVVRAAAQLTTTLDQALGHGEAPVPDRLAERVTEGAHAAAATRAATHAAATTTQASLFDTAAVAGRGFPPPGPAAAVPPVPAPPPPAAGRRRR